MGSRPQSGKPTNRDAVATEPSSSTCFSQSPGGGPPSRHGCVLRASPSPDLHAPITSPPPSFSDHPKSGEGRRETRQQAGGQEGSGHAHSGVMVRRGHLKSFCGCQKSLGCLPLPLAKTTRGRQCSTFWKETANPSQGGAQKACFSGPQDSQVHCLSERMEKGGTEGTGPSSSITRPSCLLTSSPPNRPLHCALPVCLQPREEARPGTASPWSGGNLWEGGRLVMAGGKVPGDLGPHPRQLLQQDARSLGAWAAAFRRACPR